MVLRWYHPSWTALSPPLSRSLKFGGVLISFHDSFFKLIVNPLVFSLPFTVLFLLASSSSFVLGSNCKVQTLESLIWSMRFWCEFYKSMDCTTTIATFFVVVLLRFPSVGNKVGCQMFQHRLLLVESSDYWKFLTNEKVDWNVVESEPSRCWLLSGVLWCIMRCLGPSSSSMRCRVVSFFNHRILPP